MLFGFINNSNYENDFLYSKLKQHAKRYSHQQITEIYKSINFSIFKFDKNDIGAVEISNAEHVWFTNSVPFTSSENLNAKKIIDYDWKIPLNIDGIGIAIYWNECTKTFRIATDWFGISWIYIAEIPGGYLFSSDFGLISSLSPNILSLNNEAIICELILGYVPDDSTVFKSISLLPAGAVFQIDASGITKILQRSFNYGDKFNSLDDNQKYEILDEHFERVVEKVFLPQKDKMLLSLSGGYDSRFALALLDRAGLSPSCFTFGNLDSSEVYDAINIAERVGLQTTVHNIPDAHWNVWVRSIQQLGNTGMLQWAGWIDSWLRLLQDNGESVIIGYYGDALSGKHLVRSKRCDSDDWLGHWINWSIEDWTCNSLLKEDVLSNAYDIVVSGFQRLSVTAKFEYKHQEAMHYDLFGRQRRWVAGQPNLINKFISPICFFCDAELAEFWMNLPLTDLENQRLYLGYGRSRFPHLFNSTTVENTENGFLYKLLRRFRWGYEKNKPNKYVPPIDRHKIVLHNKSNIIEIIESSSSVIDDYIKVTDLIDLVNGYNSQQSPANSSNAIIMRIVNLLILLETSI